MTAGYSGTPQARKLGLKAGQRVALDEPPADWQLREPPDGLLVPGADGAADLIIAFFQAEIEIADRLPALARRIFPAGALWAAWPRRAGGHDSDITDNVVRRHALGIGLVDVKVAAIDEDWSGLRLVWRVSNRLPGRADFGDAPPLSSMFSDMSLRWYTVVVDCHDVKAQSRWWAEVLGWQRR